MNPFFSLLRTGAVVSLKGKIVNIAGEGYDPRGRTVSVKLRGGAEIGLWESHIDSIDWLPDEPKEDTMKATAATKMLTLGKDELCAGDRLALKAYVVKVPLRPQQDPFLTVSIGGNHLCIHRDTIEYATRRDYFPSPGEEFTWGTGAYGATCLWADREKGILFQRGSSEYPVFEKIGYFCDLRPWDGVF